MLHRVDPPIWFNTPDGTGLAHFVRDEGLEHSLYWVIFLEETGQVWTYPNEKVRALRNYTVDRRNPEKPAPRQSEPGARS